MGDEPLPKMRSAISVGRVHLEKREVGASRKWGGGGTFRFAEAGLSCCQMLPSWRLSSRSGQVGPSRGREGYF